MARAAPRAPAPAPAASARVLSLAPPGWEQPRAVPRRCRGARAGCLLGKHRGSATQPLRSAPKHAHSVPAQPLSQGFWGHEQRGTHLVLSPAPAAAVPWVGPCLPWQLKAVVSSGAPECCCACAAALACGFRPESCPRFLPAGIIPQTGEHLPCRHRQQAPSWLCAKATKTGFGAQSRCNPPSLPLPAFPGPPCLPPWLSFPPLRVLGCLSQVGRGSCAGSTLLTSQPGSPHPWAPSTSAAVGAGSCAGAGRAQLPAAGAL